MGLLAQITIWEVMSALILVFTFFSLIFRVPQIASNRDVSNLFIISRDFLKTMDNINMTYFVFNNVSLFDSVTSRLFREELYLPQFLRKNTIKERIVVAANCSDQEIDFLTSWFSKVRLNRRNIYIHFVQSSLSSIPPQSDLLIICGYRDLRNHKSNLLSYLSANKGIVGFFDVSTIDQATKEIFGIDLIAEGLEIRDTNISVPLSAFQPNYLPYKYFYGVPQRINAPNLNVSSGNYMGNFTFRNYTAPFEINYSSREVYFYTPERITVRERQTFSLYGYNFLLSYVQNSSIFLSFRKYYNFTNFLGNNRVYLTDNNENRIFLFAGYYSSGKRVPVAVMNGSRVAWIANFNRYGNATDDQKLALLSLILSVSNKDFSYGFYARNPVLVPYVDVENYDVFEAYSINFGYSLP